MSATSYPNPGNTGKDYSHLPLIFCLRDSNTPRVYLQGLVESCLMQHGCGGNCFGQVIITGSI